MRLYRKVVAFIKSLLNFLGFCLIAFVVYSDVMTPIGLILSFIIVCTGIYLSYKLYILMVRRGILEVMSGDNATPDVDKLEPVSGDGVLKIKASELAALWKENQIEFKGGKVIVWGDWDGRMLNQYHKIGDIAFDDNQKKLDIHFDDNCSLSVFNPRLIFITVTYIKVVKADMVRWEISNGQYFSYRFTKNKIDTASNTNWKPHEYDVGIGKNAVFIS